MELNFVKEFKNFGQFTDQIKKKQYRWYIAHRHCLLRKLYTHQYLYTAGLLLTTIDRILYIHTSDIDQQSTSSCTRDHDYYYI